MQTSYKFWYVKREDDLRISEVAVRFYEGNILPVTEKKLNKNTQEIMSKEVNKYKIIKRLSESELPYQKGAKFIKESNDNDCAVYTSKDFGITKDLDDIIVFLNSVISKDTERTTEDTQKETKKSLLVKQLIK